MKKYILILLALLAFGCSTDSSIIDNDFEAQMELLEEIELMDSYYGFGFDIYAQSNPLLPGNLKGVPIDYSHFNIKENYLLTGLQYDNGNQESIEGSMKLFGTEMEGESFLINNISGKFRNINDELIFYHGKMMIDLALEEITGHIVFSNGTGQYSGCSGEVEINGHLEYGYLKIDCNGAMNLMH